MITLTQTAAQRVKELIGNEQNQNLALRIGLKGGGCSGMTYVLALDEAAPKEEDTVLEQDGLKILIDEKSRSILEGTTIDYKNDLSGGGFEFSNPQAKRTCGCGTSFSV